MAIIISFWQWWRLSKMTKTMMVKKTGCSKHRPYQWAPLRVAEAHKVKSIIYSAFGFPWIGLLSCQSYIHSISYDWHQKLKKKSFSKARSTIGHLGDWLHSISYPDSFLSHCILIVYWLIVSILGDWLYPNQMWKPGTSLRLLIRWQRRPNSAKARWKQE